MSRATDLLAAGNAVRHCAAPECRKCLARGRWYRRKAWRSGKRPARRNNRRK